MPTPHCSVQCGLLPDPKWVLQSNPSGIHLGKLYVVEQMQVLKSHGKDTENENKNAEMCLGLLSVVIGISDFFPF